MSATAIEPEKSDSNLNQLDRLASDFLIKRITKWGKMASVVSFLVE